jgi:23S rRNA (cytidine1920-2'-O)/16S rRNA (cytidine1409-2'-O)-methyltransferase
MAVRRRLDAELVRRGLAPTRSAAADAIRSGRVIVAGRPTMKAATLVAPGEPVVLTAPARPFASRAGEKLNAGLDRFGLDVTGRLALDIGASTGGFTDVLLRRGVAALVAVDVGYGQLAWSLRNDPRVTVMDRTNARDLGPEALAFQPDLVVADVSFISLRLVIPAIGAVAASSADAVLLVKPQFEAGKDQVPSGGVVRDPDVWRACIESVAEVARAHGFDARSVMASPLPGASGNVEFLLHAVRGGALKAEGDFDAAADAAVREGLDLGNGGAGDA